MRSLAFDKTKGKTMSHGTMKSYRKGCKCAACKGVNASYQRDYQARKKMKTDVNKNGSVLNETDSQFECRGCGLSESADHRYCNG